MMDQQAQPVQQDKLGGAPEGKQALRLWLRLLTCTSLIERRVRKNLREKFNTTLPRFDILATLDYVARPMSMGELSRHLMVSNGNVTGLVDRLESEGLIKREASPDDRRTHRVSLTTKGRRDFRAMAETHESWISSMFADLSDDEVEDLLDLLNRTKVSLQQSRGNTDA